MRTILALLSLSMCSASATTMVDVMKMIPGGVLMSVADCEKVKVGYAPNFTVPTCFKFEGYPVEAVMTISMQLAITSKYRFVLADYQAGEPLFGDLKLPDVQTFVWSLSDPKIFALMKFMGGGMLDSTVWVIVSETPR